ncbi:MAG: DUF58 domain-containing protein [Oscillospiraceae bacterium]|nr:DUF58 domain-containing protein [Oscillospiraceae bacterium]
MVFYVFYREWFSWFFLAGLLLLPWFSLAVSLPAMLTVKAGLRCPETARQDMPVRTSLQLDCKLPTPPVRCQLRVTNVLTGERFLGMPGERIPTEHCGMITISYPRLYVYDYLGLFRRQLNREESRDVFIMPKPVPDDMPLKPEGSGVSMWRPKPGGGFSEIHDLRLYRPGDDLKHIHWKMSAKTGKLIYREPMEPVQKGYVLNITVSGTTEELDRKLGKLLWTSRMLLEREFTHTVRAMTAKGLVLYTVENEASLEACLRSLLGTPKAETTAVDGAADALWQHHIGGDSHEK